MRQGEAAGVHGPVDALDPGHRTPRQPGQQRLGVERRREGQAHAYSLAINKVPGDIDHLLRLLGALLGLDVVDVGCGGGGFVAQLAEQGARATGVEVTEAKVAAARTDHDGRFVLGRGEALPLPDASQDLVVYLRALHHVPIAAMDDALREARRVLRGDGTLYVVEPLPEGDFFGLVSLVEDETEVRAAAQAALARAPGIGLEVTHEERYELAGLFRNLDDVRARIVAVDPARAAIFDARRDELQHRFDTGGEPRGPLRWFTMPQRATVLRSIAWTT